MAATVQLPRHKLTVVDFQRLGAAGILTESDRVELIDGELMDMAPMSSLHADYVDRLAQILTVQNCGDYRVRVQNPVRLDDDSEVAPDLALVVNRGYRDAHPTSGDVLLLIEVADATMAYDQELKIPLIRPAWYPGGLAVECDGGADGVLSRTGAGELSGESDSGTR